MRVEKAGGSISNSNKELVDLKAQQSELLNAKSELGRMEESEQLFEIKSSLFLGKGGKTVYNKSQDAVVFKMGLNSDYSTLGHELKHGYQFLRGDISFRPNGKRGSLADIGDEVAGYKRQYALNPERVKRGIPGVTLMSQINANNVRNLIKAYESLPITTRNLRTTDVDNKEIVVDPKRIEP